MRVPIPPFHDCDACPYAFALAERPGPLQEAVCRAQGAGAREGKGEPGTACFQGVCHQHGGDGEEAKGAERGDLEGHQTLRPPSASITTSPSSLVKAPFWASGRISSTASDGRHSLAPSGVTTMGRLIRMGWAIMASISASSPSAGSSSPNSAYGVPFSRSRARAEMFISLSRVTSSSRDGGVLRY